MRVDFIVKLGWILLISAFTILSCSEAVDADDEPSNPSVPNENAVEVITPTGAENYLNSKSKYIFDQNKLHTFELNLPPDHLAELDRDPTAEEYVEGSLTFEGETISPVGIRYKGSIGAYVNCVSGSDWANPSGRKTCTKLSVKVKVNWQDKDDKFFGLKKLQFHSQNLDKSQMRDRLGYHLFQEMGVPAPRAVHARLVINGQFTGVYAMIEQIDGRFTRQNFDDGKGNLYKEIWPLQANGTPFSAQQYKDALETNEDENPDVEMIQSFAKEIQNASTNESMKAVVNKWMNIDEIMSYIVVDRLIRVDDGPFHWYCGGGISNSSACSSHNFYWYEDPTNRKMHLVPWDLDNAFENILFDRNPVTPIKDGWGEITNHCEPFRHGVFGGLQRSAACDKLTSAWVLFGEEFEEAKTKFIEGPLAEENVNALLDQWSAQIADATKEADDSHNDAVTVDQWHTAVDQLKSSLEFVRNR